MRKVRRDENDIQTERGTNFAYHHSKPVDVGNNNAPLDGSSKNYEPSGV